MRSQVVSWSHANLTLRFYGPSDDYGNCTQLAALGACSTYLCPTCQAAGYCDHTCHFNCDGGNPSGDASNSCIHGMKCSQPMVERAKNSASFARVARHSWHLTTYGFVGRRQKSALR